MDFRHVLAAWRRARCREVRYVGRLSRITVVVVSTDGRFIVLLVLVAAVSMGADDGAIKTGDSLSTSRKTRVCVHALAGSNQRYIYIYIPSLIYFALYSWF